MSWTESSPGRAGGTALIGKALRLIDAIGNAPDARDVADLLAETGWPRPTLYRILSALVAEGYVRRDPALGRYTLGYRILELAQNAWAGSDLVAVASLELQRLRNLTGETAYLAIPHRDGVLSLGKFESPHAVRSAARLGVLKPFHCTSQGKAMLAAWDEAERDRRLGPEPFRRYTPATLTRRAEIDDQLAATRDRGFAIEDEEILPGSRCVGVAVLDEHGRPVAAISVAGPAWRLAHERARQLGPELVDAARRIGLMLPSRERAGRSAPGAVVVADRGEPAFHGADPYWDAARSVLVWTDRLGQAIRTTATTGHDARRVLPASPVVCSVHTGERSLVFMADDAWSVAAGEVRPLVPRDLATGVTAACTTPDGGVLLAVRRGDVTVVGRLQEAGGRAGVRAGGRADVRAGVRAVWTVGGPVSALACAPDGAQVFAACSARGIVYASDEGRSTMRVFSRIPAASGRPSGLAVDARGALWVALDAGWAVVRLDASGEFAATRPLPVPRPTGLAFGGEGGSTLFVTTARYGLSRDTLERAPLSGHVLALAPGTDPSSARPRRPRVQGSAKAPAKGRPPRDGLPQRG